MAVTVDAYFLRLDGERGKPEAARWKQRSADHRVKFDIFCEIVFAIVLKNAVRTADEVCFSEAVSQLETAWLFWLTFFFAPDSSTFTFDPKFSLLFPLSQIHRLCDPMRFTRKRILVFHPKNNAHCTHSLSYTGARFE